MSQELAAARQRNVEQLAEQRARNERVEDALLGYFHACDALTAAEGDYERKREPHEQALAQLRAQRNQAVAMEQAAQARAAVAIHEAGRTVSQVAELLQVSVKTARGLIAAGRHAPSADPAEGPDPASGGPAADSAPAGADGTKPIATSPTGVGGGDHGDDPTVESGERGSVSGVPVGGVAVVTADAGAG